MTSVHHFSSDQLEAGLPEVRCSPADGGTVVQIVVRPDKDLRELPQSCDVTPEDGLSGDRWKRYCTRLLPDGQLNPDCQITLMNARANALVSGGNGRGSLSGDNLIVDLDLSVGNLPTGQRLRIGEAIIEITAKPHTGCSKFSGRFGAEALKFVNSPEGSALRLRGVHAQVVRAGRISVGDRIEKL